MNWPDYPLIFSDLTISPRWRGNDSVVLSVTRSSSSLCPHRHIGFIAVLLSSAERIPVRIIGTIPENMTEGPVIVSLCRELLAFVGLDPETPYDASLTSTRQAFGILASAKDYI